MTYKGSNWTRGELGNVPDKNPTVSCDGCGEKTNWKNAKGEWSYSNDPEEPFLCPSCADLNEPTTEERKENNQSLREFA